MRALVLRDYGIMAVETRPDPIPAKGDALVRITATGICGSDVHGFTGESGRRVPGQVMGHETVGVVEKGPSDGPRPGSIVTVNPVLFCGYCPICRSGREQACLNKRVIGVTAELSSAFAELMAVPVRNLELLPQTMPVEYGALVEPLAVGYHALRRGGAEHSDTVLIIGGGPIGQACALAARRLDIDRLAVSEPVPRRRALVEEFGAVALDPNENDLPGQATRALGKAPTLVVDAVGLSATVRDAFQTCAPAGRVVLVGMGAHSLEVPAYAVSTEERTLIGSFCYSAREFTETAHWVADEPKELAQLIEGRIELDEAPEAFISIAEGRNQASKVLVFPNGVVEA